MKLVVAFFLFFLPVSWSSVTLTFPHWEEEYSFFTEDRIPVEWITDASSYCENVKLLIQVARIDDTSTWLEVGAEAMTKREAKVTLPSILNDGEDSTKFVLRIVTETPETPPCDGEDRFYGLNLVRPVEPEPDDKPFFLSSPNSFGHISVDQIVRFEWQTTSEFPTECQGQSVEIFISEAEEEDWKLIGKEKISSGYVYGRVPNLLTSDELTTTVKLKSKIVPNASLKTECSFDDTNENIELSFKKYFLPLRVSFPGPWEDFYVDQLAVVTWNFDEELMLLGCKNLNVEVFFAHESDPKAWKSLGSDEINAKHLPVTIPDYGGVEDGVNRAWLKAVTTADETGKLGTDCIFEYLVENIQLNIYEYATFEPTAFPSALPTSFPSVSDETTFPTSFPVAPATDFPTSFPTQFPTGFPTANPTPFPSSFPTQFPTNFPSASPTNFPSLAPSPFPTVFPSTFPTPFPIALDN